MIFKHWLDDWFSTFHYKVTTFDAQYFLLYTYISNIMIDLFLGVG